MMKFGAPVEIKDFKADGDDWKVSGYASTFDNIDLGYDVVMPGAFDRTLKERRRVSFLHSHDMRMVLGTVQKMHTDKRGLFGEFKISQTQLGKDTRQLLMDGAMGGFSIGYQTNEADMTKDGIRQLKDVDLIEVSVVAIPMNPEAVITNVKDYLSAIGIAPDMTIAEKAAALTEQLHQLLDDTRSLTEKERPLSNTKRQELTSLLETFSSLDAVRTDLTAIMDAAPFISVSGKRALWELSQRRKRLSRILT
jgi:HK97 family phage prohead protease